jgi:glycosyltransferase involved in cell wall biosynthesis
MYAKTVVHLMDFGAPYPGNFIASLVALEQRLAIGGNKLIYVFPPRVAEREWFATFRKGRESRVFVLDRKIKYLSDILAIRRILSQQGGDIIHTHFSSFDLTAAIAARIAKPIGGIPVIWHVHSPWPHPPGLKKVIRETIRYRIVGRSAHLVGVSEGARLMMRDRPINDSNFHVILNGVDFARLRVDGQSRFPEVRREMGVGEQEFAFLLFGWDIRRKAVDVALEAAGRLSLKSSVRFKFIIVGKDDLFRYVEEHFSGATPDWLLLLKPTTEIGKIYAAVDCFCSFSRAEGFSYAVCEAMASAKPVISSDIHGLEWAKGHDGVMFFEGFDGNSAAGCMARMMALSPAEREAMGAENRDFVTGALSVDRWCEDVTRLYDHVLS